jgi:hypothetical protein
MTQKSFDLDTAIDLVAKQLSHVEDDPQFASRIVTALPERVTWFGWLMHSWAPRLAMVAIVIGAAIVWGNRSSEHVSTVEALASSQPMQTPVALTAGVRTFEPQRTKPLDPLEPLEPLEPATADFERSLAAVPALEEIGIAALAPRDLPAESSITIAPLAIPELALTNDFPPERD